METYSYKSFGDTAAELEVIVETTKYFDASDPTVDEEVEHDYSDDGYDTDDEELDGGVSIGEPGTRSELRYYIYVQGNPNQFVPVRVGGQEVPANGIPLRFIADHPTMARFVCNVPRMAGVVLEVAVVFKRPGKRTPIVYKFLIAL